MKKMITAANYLTVNHFQFIFGSNNYKTELTETPHLGKGNAMVNTLKMWSKIPKFSQQNTRNKDFLVNSQLARKPH